MDRLSKKGWAEGLMLFFIIGIVAIIFFAGWIYASALLRTQLATIGYDSNSTNVTDAAKSTYNYLDNGLKNGLPLVALTILIGFAIATLIMAYFSIEHPVMIFVYVVFIIMVFIAGVYVSNSYSELLSNDVLGTTLSTFTVSNYILSHLPLWITVIGFIGIILMIGGRYLA